MRMVLKTISDDMMIKMTLATSPARSANVVAAAIFWMALRRSPLKLGGWSGSACSL